MTRWCGSRRISRSAIRWSTGRAISAISTAITRRRCATPKAASPPSPRRCSPGIDENAVDFRPTYDGENNEPVVLPARFPNLLANGATGIAVGMATSIPPHNILELCDALAHLVKHPRATVAELVELLPGPDFPTGGVLVEDARRDHARPTTTGRGSFRLRANWESDAAEPRRLPGRRHRDPLPGAEIAPHRAHRAAARGEEAAAPRRRAR